MKLAKITFRRSKAFFLISLTLFILTFSTSVWAAPIRNGKVDLNQATNKSDSGLNFSIENLSPYIIQNSALKLSVDTKSKDTLFRIEVFKATNTRSEFYKFVNDLGNRRVSDSLEIPISGFSIDPQVQGRYSIDIPINAEPQTSISLNSAGVYPIAISQQKQGEKATETQYSFTTYVPNIGSNGAAYSQKLQTVPLIKYSPTIGATRLLRDDRTLTTYGKKIQNEFLVAQKTTDSISKIDVPKSILLNPESFNIYTFLKNSSSSNSVAPQLFSPSPNDFNEYLADSYVPVSVAELEKQQSTGAFPELVTIGRSIINQAGFAAPSRTLVTKSISKNTIDLIAKTGIDRVIVEDKNFTPDLRPVHSPSVLKQEDVALGVATYDTQIAENLPASLSGSAVANYMIAATSVVTLEKPSVERGFIIPLDLNDLSEKTISIFLNAAKTSPYIEPVSSDIYFRDLKENKNQSKKLLKAAFPVNIGKSISKSDHDQIDSYTTATESCFPESSEFTFLARWMRLTSYSSSDRKISKLIGVNQVKNLTMKIEKLIDLPKERTLTITSRENEIPVTIRRNYDKPIDIVINIKGDKLSFPKGQRFPVKLNQENTTLRVPVKARTSGSFRISIEVLTPKESVVLGQQNATVRSTVVSGAGIGIASAAIIFLAIWWLSHWRRDRKKPIAEVIELPQENAV